MLSFTSQKKFCFISTFSLTTFSLSIDTTVSAAYNWLINCAIAWDEPRLTDNLTQWIAKTGF